MADLCTENNEIKSVEIKEINTGRQYNLDLLKAFSIICMIICHAVISLGAYRDGFENEFWFSFGDDILGSYAGVAHAFMFAMGFGFVFTKKNSPSDLLKRGIKIYLLAYILNISRFTLFIFIRDCIWGEFSTALIYYTLMQDILQFAGLAMILTAFLKKTGLKETGILIVAVVLSCIGGPLAFIYQKEDFLNYILCSFIATTESITGFPVFNWYIFVAAGMFFARKFRQIEDTDRFYKKLFIVSAAVMAVYLILTAKFGIYFLSKNYNYYSASILEAVGLLSIDFVLLSAFYFLLKVVSIEKMSLLMYMSRSITQIYFIHWCVTGFLAVFICRMMGIVFSYPVIYLIGFLNVIASVLVSRLVDKIKEKSRKSIS